jgi:hypothetical protein
LDFFSTATSLKKELSFVNFGPKKVGKFWISLIKPGAVGFCIFKNLQNIFFKN